MIYDCLFYNQEFIVAKPVGHEWSHSERALPFTLELTVALEPEVEDYIVSLDNGASVMASEIDPGLVMGAII